MEQAISTYSMQKNELRTSLLLFIEEFIKIKDRYRIDGTALTTLVRILFTIRTGAKTTEMVILVQTLEVKSS
jgi:hypothetical protein